MNLIHQRDDLKQACAAGAISEKQLEMALLSPVFQWYNGERNMSADEEEWLKDNLMDEIPLAAGAPEKGFILVPRVVPFECFRVSYLDYPVYEQWFIGEGKMLCFRCDDGYSDTKVRLWSLHDLKRGEIKYRLWLWANGLAMNPETMRAGKVEMITTAKERSDFATSPTNALTFLLFDMYSKSSSIIKVSPNTPGKSVIWRKAREHYLVLQNSQAKQLQKTKRPHTDADLVRSAHRRRAHLRRLSSDKFTSKRGLLVPVKESWVGPQEWIGTDNKIYTIINPVQKKVSG